MILRLTACLLLATTVATTPALPQGAGGPPPTGPPSPGQDAPSQPRIPGGFTEEVSWTMRMAFRIQLIRGAFPISKQVVLVPDAATYLDELSRWTKDARWPVLFEDDYYAPMFIRRYEPLEVFRRESVGSLPRDHDERKALIQQIIANSWRLDGSTATTGPEAFAERKFQPIGMVFTSLEDPAWTAGVALAAAHGQYIGWLDGDWGKADEVLHASRTKRLLETISTELEATGMPWKGLGDGIDMLTVCRAMCARVDTDIKTPLPENFPPDIANGPKAVTDVIGRNPDGTRNAFAGWINGGQRASCYAAMCSYFLPRSRVWLGDSYTDEDGGLVYGLAESARLFKRLGYEVQLDENLTLASFRAAAPGGLDADLVMINSKGNADFFDLGTDRIAPVEAPILNTPAVLYLLHSWSLKRPESTDTVGGRWIRNGAYALVGSSHEPLLSGFVPPTEVTRRLVGRLPLGMAVRWWPGEGPLSAPWRINLLGDPFMACNPPDYMKRKIAPNNGGGATNLNKEALASLDAAVNEPSDASFTKAIRLHQLIDQDAMGVDLWHRAVKEKVAGPECARAALGSLFRAQDRDGFMNAWSMLPRHTSYDKDMIWELMGPTLGPGTDERTAALLDAAVRKQYPSGDLVRLAPTLNRIHGRSMVLGRIDDASRSAANRREKKALEQLRSQYE